MMNDNKGDMADIDEIRKNAVGEDTIAGEDIDSDEYKASSDHVQEKHEDLIEKIVEDGYLKLRSVNSSSTADLDMDHLLKLSNGGLPLTGGGQSLVYKVDFYEKEELDNVLIVPLLAHELAKKDSLESQTVRKQYPDMEIPKKPKKEAWEAMTEKERTAHQEKVDLYLERKSKALEDVSMIEIDENLNALLYRQDGKEVKKENMIAGYSWTRIRKSGKDFIQDARAAINNNNPEALEYLKKRGFLKSGTFSDHNIKQIVKRMLGKRREEMEKVGVAKVSFLSPQENPKGKREQNFAGVVHPNTIYIGMYGSTHGDRVVLFSEYFPKAIKTERLHLDLSTGQKLKVARDVAHALEFLYRVGGVSRDVKPDNILTDGTTTKMLDLGLVKFQDEGQNLIESLNSGKGSMLTQDDNQSVVGTISYMPPEQAAGNPTDTRADVWGLAGTLYTLLTGELPNQRADLRLVPNKKVVLRILHNLLSNEKRPEMPATEQLEQHYLDSKGNLAKVLTYGHITDYFRKKAKRFAYDTVATIACGRAFFPENRHNTPTQLKEDLEALVTLRRPKNALKKNAERGENVALNDAFSKVKARPKYRFQTLRNIGYAMAGAAAGVAAYIPDAVIKFVPEFADKYMQMINDAVQKVL